jgi:hypothetical protein
MILKLISNFGSGDLNAGHTIVYLGSRPTIEMSMPCVRYFYITSNGRVFYSFISPERGFQDFWVEI